MSFKSKEEMNSGLDGQTKLPVGRPETDYDAKAK